MNSQAIPKPKHRHGQERCLKTCTAHIEFTHRQHSTEGTAAQHEASSSQSVAAQINIKLSLSLRQTNLNVHGAGLDERFKVLQRVKAKLCRLAKRLSDGGAREKQTGRYRRKVKKDETL